jgi:hypothetical protein
MLNERKLTERELDSREAVIQGLLGNKRNLVKKYGKNAEKVMYGIATKKAKSKVEEMNKDKIRELIYKALTKEDNDPSGEYLEGDPGEHVEEGTCGYGEDGKIGRKPAGPHLNKEAVDIHNVNVFGYETKYFKVCPAAKAFMDKVVDGEYGDMSERKNEIIRIAKLHDLLFMRELRALKDPNYAKKIVTSGEVEYIADEIKDNSEDLGIPRADLDYVDNHVNIIFDAANKIDESLNEGHGLDQDDLDYLKDRVQPGGPIRGRLKKIIDFIIKSNILQDKTKDLSKGKVNENIEEFEVDDAVVELRRIVDEIEEKADEARDIVRDIFPNELSRLDGYGAFNAMYSANRYDTTLGKFVDRLEEEGYDIEDGIVYVNEEVSSANFAKGIDVIKSTLSKEGGAAGLEPLVKELVKLGFKKDEVIDLLSKMTSVKKHRDGDYILLPLEEKELSKSEQNSLKKIEKALRKASKSHKSQSSDLAKSTKAHKLQADKIAKIVREKLSKKNDVGDFVDDFKKSKAKQFRGKSSKKKKEMAVAAYLAKQND